MFDGGAINNYPVKRFDREKYLEDVRLKWRCLKGILNELAGNCETNRPAILDFRGKSYFFYHNGGLKNGGSHRRSVCVCADYLYYNPDGTMKRIIMTSEGVQAAK